MFDMFVFFQFETGTLSQIASRNWSYFFPGPSMTKGTTQFANIRNDAIDEIILMIF